MLHADSVRKLETDAPEIRVALSEPVEYEEYAQGLRNTKMFISPLGCGISSAGGCASCMIVPCPTGGGSCGHTKRCAECSCGTDTRCAAAKPCRKGESSGKDYEAIISRALLIKPLASTLSSYPDIYEVGVTCVEVRPLDTQLACSCRWWCWCWCCRCCCLLA